MELNTGTVFLYLSIKIQECNGSETVWYQSVQIINPLGHSKWEMLFQYSWSHVWDWENHLIYVAFLRDEETEALRGNVTWPSSSSWLVADLTSRSVFCLTTWRLRCYSEGAIGVDFPLVVLVRPYYFMFMSRLPYIFFLIKCK